MVHIRKCKFSSRHTFLAQAFDPSIHSWPQRPTEPWCGRENHEGVQQFAACAVQQCAWCVACTTCSYTLQALRAETDARLRAEELRQDDLKAELRMAKEQLVSKEQVPRWGPVSDDVPIETIKECRDPDALRVDPLFWQCRMIGNEPRSMPLSVCVPETKEPASG